MNRSFKLLLAASAAGFFAAGPASAQRIERIVAFGDSYADDGNIFELTGSPRPSVYPNGRFSNGTNFIDTMSKLLAVPVDNFAIGGAQSGNTNVSGPGLPGFALEYQSFLAGGGPAAFPRVSGKFAPNDLLAISIGWQRRPRLSAQPRHQSNFRTNCYAGCRCTGEGCGQRRRSNHWP